MFYSESDEICDVSKNIIVFTFDFLITVSVVVADFGNPIDIASFSGPFSFTGGITGAGSGSFRDL